MRFTQDEKYEIIRLVEDSELGVNRTLGELDISKRRFYNWYGKYTKHGYDGLSPKRRANNSTNDITNITNPSRGVQVNPRPARLPARVCPVSLPHVSCRLRACASQ